ncbi:TIGR00266 family protein [Spirochaetia bacterium]|nr:TIGR00266 family protein [Spirochaetia bacterium]
MKYEIKGSTYPVAICYLESGEQVTCQSGAMLWMSTNMKMNTGTGGGIGKIFSRAISGEGLFQNTYTAEGGPGMIAFGTTAPGEIVPIDVSKQSIIAQKGAFLASELSVQSEITLQKKLGASFFGGEGFILQKFTGYGTVLLSIDGTTVKYSLRAGEQMILDTGAFAFAESSITVDVQMIKGIGNIVAGGEGLFNTLVTGPGSLWLQTLPLSVFAQTISKFIPGK